MSIVISSELVNLSLYLSLYNTHSPCVLVFNTCPVCEYRMLLIAQHFDVQFVLVVDLICVSRVLPESDSPTGLVFLP